jgi:BirA family biotin operon repressor/biotin-[acetyl-CoA-carboxylase] ligase
VDSTSDELRRRAERGAPDGSVVVADEQTAGRGRRGRSWHSPPGSGLYLSVLFRGIGEGPLVTRWTLGAGLAACRACRRVSAAPIEIDWPNDLVSGGRKLGGILTELRGRSELVVGTGINLELEEQGLPSELVPLVTSLSEAAGRIMLDRETLATEYLHELARVAAVLRGGDFATLAREWLELAPGARGRRVRVLTPSAVRGTTAGVDESGALLVRLVDGKTVAVRMVDAVEPDED